MTLGPHDYTPAPTPGVTVTTTDPDPGFLVVDPAVVARRLGVRGTLDAEVAEEITDAILEAQAVVEGEINRSVQQTHVTYTGIYPTGADVNHWRTWPVHLDEVYGVSTATQDTNGAWTVVLTVGIDARKEPPIVAYVTAHAAVTLRERPESPLGKRAVTSLSAEGQSVSYAQTTTTPGTAGAPLDLKMLRRYKRRAVFKRNGPAAPPWPYRGAPVGYRQW